MPQTPIKSNPQLQLTVCNGRPVMYEEYIDFNRTVLSCCSVAVLQCCSQSVAVLQLECYSVAVND